MAMVSFLACSFRILNCCQNGVDIDLLDKKLDTSNMAVFL